MIKYNTTIKIETESAEEWLSWMIKEHIPEIMKTGFFLSSSINILSYPLDEQGKTYSIQYLCESIHKLNEYVNTHGVQLEGKQEAKFKEKFVTFSSVLQEIENF